jgi:hypothetical protein
MVEVSAETEVFSSEKDERALVLFLGKLNHDSRGGNRRRIVSTVIESIERWRTAGWRTSVADMFEDSDEPTVYETGFAHDIDVVGVFEAPSLAAAYSSIDELKEAGWDELFATEWVVGLREFVPVPSPLGRDAGAPWALFALWEWNDAWQAASQAERHEYDIECDEAFTSDIESGVSIAGRHRLDPQSRWHHLGIWEAPTFEHITNGMLSHERVADFKFTTSRHYVGRRRPLSEYLGALS